jgi:hypothetical protein
MIKIDIQLCRVVAPQIVTVSRRSGSEISIASRIGGCQMRDLRWGTPQGENGARFHVQSQANRSRMQVV